MAKFTVRVELHGVKGIEPSGEDYQELHLAMQRNSYFRIIKSSDDEWSHLPSAEYTVNWDVKIDSVVNEVKTIVAAVWKPFSVLVTESNGRQWYGLKPASSDEVAELLRTDV